MKRFICIQVIALVPLLVFAGNKGTLTYAGRIVLPNGQPEQSSTVIFSFQILAPNGCVLWQETSSALDMSNSSGAFSTQIGSGANSAAGGLSWAQVFQNRITLGGGGLTGTGCSGTYTGAASDDRTMYVTINDGSGTGSQVVGPVALKSVAQNAMFAGYPVVGAPTDQQALIFSSSSQAWVPGSVSASFSAVSLISNSGGSITLTPQASGGSVVINSTTASTGTTSGALVVSGGVGVTGNVYTGGTITASGAVSATSFTIGGANAISFANDTALPGASIGIGSGSLALQPTTLSNMSYAVSTDPPTGTYANTAVGYQSLAGASGGYGYGNTAMGFQAEKSVSGGANNTALGYQALRAEGGGYNNVAVGGNALANETYGYQNTAVGFSAMKFNLSGIQNTAIGQGARIAATTGTGNVVVGMNAMSVATGGSYNTIVGYSAASSTLTTGGSNILIGRGVDTLTPGTSNFLNIGNLIFATGMSGSLTSPAGSVGIATNSPSYPLDVVGDVNSSSAIRVAGTQVCTSSGCTSSSDRRLKENIKPIQNSLENILKLQGVTYDWKDKEKYGHGPQIGLIAQDLEKVFPEVVMTDSKTGLKSVAYDHLAAPLIEGMKSLYIKSTSCDQSLQQHNRDIAALKHENENLRKENADIRAQIELIRSKLGMK